MEIFVDKTELIAYTIEKYQKWFILIYIFTFFWCYCWLYITVYLLNTDGMYPFSADRSGTDSKVWKAWNAVVYRTSFWWMYIYEGSSPDYMGIGMIMNMFDSFNPWILFDDSLLALGLEWKEWMADDIHLFRILRLGKELGWCAFSWK